MGLTHICIRYRLGPRLNEEVNEMKSAVYGRVSTDDQVKNYSIASQLEAMRVFAVEHNLDVVKEFVDEGVSGTVLDRPALNQLREFAGEKKLDAVIV